MTADPPSVAVIYVAYGVAELNLAWVPADVPIIVVHNDDRLASSWPECPNVRDLHPGANVGFGAGVNCAIAEVNTERVILCNPDTTLRRTHFDALVDAAPNELVTVPLIDSDGTPNAVVSPYWSLPAFLATALRLGRLAPRHSRRRRAVIHLLGRFGRGHREALEQTPGSWSLVERWASGAVISAPTQLIRDVGGFDEAYFLYYEDADIQQRIARSNPETFIRLADVEAGIHEVGGCVAGSDAAASVSRHRRRSAVRYASLQSGPGWGIAAALLGVGVR